MFEAIITMDGAAAQAVADSIGPESGRELPRTRSQVELSEEHMRIRIEADDASAMRAALNSYLECIAVVQSVQRIAKAKQ